TTDDADGDVAAAAGRGSTPSCRAIAGSTSTRGSSSPHPPFGPLVIECPSPREAGRGWREAPGEGLHAYTFTNRAVTAAAIDSSGGTWTSGWTALSVCVPLSIDTSAASGAYAAISRDSPGGT